MLDMTTLDHSFQVEERKAYLDDGTEIPDMKVLTHPVTNQILGRHSNSYTPINYDQIVDNLMSAIKTSDITSDYNEKITVYEGGRKLKVDVLFPDLQFEVTNSPTQLRDVSQFRIQMFSSHDAAWKYCISADGLRLVCLNGMTFPDPLARISLKHTSRVNVDATANHIVSQLDTFKDKQSVWNTYANEYISDDYVEQFFKSKLVKKKTHSSIKKNNERQLENLMSLYHDHTQDLGNTKWALYNCLTSWSTHTDFTDNTGKRMSRSPHNTSVERTNLVKSALQSKEWEELCL